MTLQDIDIDKAIDKAHLRLTRKILKVNTKNNSTHKENLSWRYWWASTESDKVKTKS